MSRLPTTSHATRIYLYLPIVSPASILYLPHTLPLRHPNPFHSHIHTSTPAPNTPSNNSQLYNCDSPYLAHTATSLSLSPKTRDNRPGLDTANLIRNNYSTLRQFEHSIPGMSGPLSAPPTSTITPEQLEEYQNSPEHREANNATPPPDFAESDDDMHEGAGPSSPKPGTHASTLNGQPESSNAQQTKGNAMVGESQSSSADPVASGRSEEEEDDYLEELHSTYEISQDTYYAQSISPYRYYVHESALIDLEKQVKKRDEDQKLEIKELQHELAAAKKDTESAQRHSMRWMHNYFDLNDRRLGVHRNARANREAFDADELHDLRQLISLIPGYGFSDAKLKSFLKMTLPEFRTESDILEQALRRQDELQVLLTTTETKRDELSSGVTKLETKVANLKKELREAQNLHNVYQNHALFHPPLGEYRRLKVEISNQKQKIDRLEKVIKDKDEELHDVERAFLRLGWRIDCRHGPVLVQSEIQSISILPESSTVSPSALVGNQGGASPPRKKSHRGGKKHKPKTARDPHRPATTTDDEENAEDDDVNLDIVTQNLSSQVETPFNFWSSKLGAFLKIFVYFMLFGLAVYIVFVNFISVSYTAPTEQELISPSSNVSPHIDVVHPPGINSFYYVSDVVNSEVHGPLLPESIDELPTNYSTVEVLADHETVDEGPDPTVVYRLASKLFTANRMPPVSLAVQLREFQSVVAPTLEILSGAWDSWC